MRVMLNSVKTVSLQLPLIEDLICSKRSKHRTLIASSVHQHLWLSPPQIMKPGYPLEALNQAL